MILSLKTVQVTLSSAGRQPATQKVLVRTQSLDGPHGLLSFTADANSRQKQAEITLRIGFTEGVGESEHTELVKHITLPF
jgi:hypothetical protein